MDRLSRRASEDSSGQESSYFIGWKEYERNPYHPSQNPTGIIQMGLAENELSFDLIEAWLELNEDAVGLKRNGKSLFKQLALFQDYHGLPAFKKELTDFMARIRRNQVKLDPNNLVLTAGATSANEILVLCLADPGQAFLLPTPYYPGFDRDLQWRTGVKIVPVHCSSSNGFRITMSAMEEAYREAEKLKLIVKGVLITNPSNPLGRTLNLEEINDVINFATTKQIHVVSDEIYSGTVYEPPCFMSISEALMEERLRATDISKRVHIVYSLSKDLGLPGFRAGMIYSDNERVVKAATKMSSFSLVSSQTQHLLSQMLSDEKFMRQLMKVTKKRIRKRKEMLVRGLQRAGVKCLTGNGGLFCWADMRGLLRSDSFEAEEEMWERILRETGLNVSAGSSCHCSEPGWFRICFANLSEETLLVAIHRLQSFIRTVNSENQSRRAQFITKTVIND